jgi:hypothetical protein
MPPIEPAVAEPHKLARKTRSVVYKHLLMYYTSAIVLALANFIPGIIATKIGIQSPDPTEYVQLAFYTSFILSLPLILGFGLDFAARVFYPNYYQNVLEHNIGHVLLITSLAVPGVLALNSSGINAVFGSCLVECCQLVAISAIFGKLQVFSGGHWRLFNTVPMLAMVSAAQILFGNAVIRCQGESTKFIVSSILLLAVCLMLHVFTAQKYFCELHKFFFSREGSRFFDTNHTGCMILVLLLMAYFMFRIIMMCRGLQHGFLSINDTLLTRVITHMFIATFAAMLPGRMVLRMLMAMKKEMEHKKTFVRYISHEIR